MKPSWTYFGVAAVCVVSCVASWGQPAAGTSTSPGSKPVDPAIARAAFARLRDRTSAEIAERLRYVGNGRLPQDFDPGTKILPYVDDADPEIRDQAAGFLASCPVAVPVSLEKHLNANASFIERIAALRCTLASLPGAESAKPPVELLKKWANHDLCGPVAPPQFEMVALELLVWDGPHTERKHERIIAPENDGLFLRRVLANLSKGHQSFSTSNIGLLASAVQYVGPRVVVAEVSTWYPSESCADCRRAVLMQLLAVDTDNLDADVRAALAKFASAAASDDWDGECKKISARIVENCRNSEGRRKE